LGGLVLHQYLLVTLWLLVVVVEVRKDKVAGQAVAVLEVIEQAQHL